MLSRGIVNAACLPRSDGQPEPARSVKIESRSQSEGNSFDFSESLEAIVSITHQAAVMKSYPKITGGVFGEDIRPVERRDTIFFGIAMKGVSRALPSGQRFGRVECANPDVSTRIFKQARDIIIG